MHHRHLKGGGALHHQPRSHSFTTSPTVSHLLASLLTDISYQMLHWVNIVMLLLLLHININEAKIQAFLHRHKNPPSGPEFTFEKSDKEKPIFGLRVIQLISAYM